MQNWKLPANHFNLLLLLAYLQISFEISMHQFQNEQCLGIICVISHILKLSFPCLQQSTFHWRRLSFGKSQPDRLSHVFRHEMTKTSFPVSQAFLIFVVQIHFHNHCHEEPRHQTSAQSRARSWGPAHHTELASSQLGSGTPHWTRRIAVEVQHATLNSRDHSWGPARHTELAGSRYATLNSRARRWGRHATLNSQDRNLDLTRRRTTGGGRRMSTGIQEYKRRRDYYKI